MAAPEFLLPDWPVPARVRAAVTTRRGGVSRGRFADFNLGSHVGDDEAAVADNRARLASALALPVVPAWLEQVHGTDVAVLPRKTASPADAAVTFSPGEVCAVLVAD